MSLEKYGWAIQKSLSAHCVKSVRIRSSFWSVFSRNRTEYGPEKTPYLGTFHAVQRSTRVKKCLTLLQNVLAFSKTNHLQIDSRI